MTEGSGNAAPGRPLVAGALGGDAERIGGEVLRVQPRATPQENAELERAIGAVDQQPIDVGGDQPPARFRRDEPVVDEPPAPLRHDEPVVDELALGLEDEQPLELGAAEPPAVAVVPQPRADDRTVALLASLGRFAAIWIAVATVVVGAGRPFDAHEVLAITVASGFWFSTLRHASVTLPYSLGILPTTGAGTVLGSVFVLAVNPWVPAMRLPAVVLLVGAIAVFVVVVAWELFVERVTHKRRVLVIGTGAFMEIEREMRRSRRPPFRVMGALGDDRPHCGHEAPALAPVDTLADIVRAHRPAYIVLSEEAAASTTLDSLVEISDDRFRVAGLTAFFEYAFGRVPMQHLTSMWFMGIVHVRHRAYRRWAKRAFDIVVALTGLIVSAPLMPLIVALVKTSPGPVIYSQTRLGARGRRFTIYKFRTMVDGAEGGVARWFTTTDPRTTRAGAFLRRTHLDELPQLWNVLKGEMSIVGPRPERPEFVDLLEREVPFWNRRLLIEPGLTGWAQVHCGYASSAATAAEKLSYDFWYLRHRSVAVDIAVCARTLMLALPWFRPQPLTAEEPVTL